MLIATGLKPISKSALTILINLADDKEILHKLATDDAFVETLLLRITVCLVDGRAHNERRILTRPALAERRRA